jgi:hypothetical protein
MVSAEISCGSVRVALSNTSSFQGLWVLYFEGTFGASWRLTRQAVDQNAMVFPNKACNARPRRNYMFDRSFR